MIAIAAILMNVGHPGLYAYAFSKDGATTTSDVPQKREIDLEQTV